MLVNACELSEMSCISIFRVRSEILSILVFVLDCMSKIDEHKLIFLSRRRGENLFGFYVPMNYEL